MEGKNTLWPKDRLHNHIPSHDRVLNENIIAALKLFPRTTEIIAIPSHCLFVFTTVISIYDNVGEVGHHNNKGGVGHPPLLDSANGVGKP
jgi:hypothetical protein